MSTEAIALFIVAALSLAAYLIVSSIRMGRLEDREIADANARAERARGEAEAARALRARLTEPVDVAAQLVAAMTDPRGLGDGLDPRTPDPLRTGRFDRAKTERPAPTPPVGQRVRT